MAQFQITQNGYPAVTCVPDDFIKNYMPMANGDYVRIYLYLLCCAKNGTQICVSTLADLFQCTENDIKRALRYWESKQLLHIEENESGELTGLTLTGGQAASVPEIQSMPEAPVPSDAAPEQHSYTAAEMKAFKEQTEIKQLLFVCEKYIGKPLTRTEIETLLYFYDGLQFSTDLIEYLVEYSVSRGKRSFRYMRAVALEWHKNGFQTREDAKMASKPVPKECYLVFKAFGITNRSPVPSEVSYVNRWLNDYGFTTDIILEACNRTILRLHQPNFDYTDGILNGWRKAGVHHLSDIERLSEERKARTQAKAPVKNDKPFTTRFHNFEQRSYNSEELEKFFIN